MWCVVCTRFAASHIGWPSAKVDGILLPVLKKMNAPEVSRVTMAPEAGGITMAPASDGGVHPHLCLFQSATCACFVDVCDVLS